MTMYMIQKQGPGFRQMMEQINEWRKQDILCDVVLKTTSGNISAHRCILAAYSQYFASMFMLQFSEKQTKVVDVTEVTARGEDFCQIINAMYTGSIKINEENILSMLHLSSFLLWDEVKSFCMKFMHDHMALEQCVSYYIGSQYYEMSRIQQHAETILLARFHDYFMQKDESLQLPTCALEKLVNLNIQKHCRVSDFMDFLLKWCLFEKTEDRLKGLNSILNKLPSEGLPKSIQELLTSSEFSKEDSFTKRGTLLLQRLQDEIRHNETEIILQERDDDSLSTESPKAGTSSDSENSSCIWQVIHEAIMKRDVKQEAPPVVTACHSQICLTNPTNVLRNLQGIDAIILVAPSGETVKKWFGLDQYSKCSLSYKGKTLLKDRFTEGACEQSMIQEVKPENQNQALCITAFVPSQQMWYSLGSYSEDLVPGGFLHQRNSCHWRICYFLNKLYFFSNLFKLGFTLDPVHNCVHSVSFPTNIENDLDGMYRYALPIVANQCLYLLAIYAKHLQEDKLYQVTYQYFMLLADNTWMKMIETQTNQNNVGTPYLYAADNKIFMLSLEKGGLFGGQNSMYTIGCGHIFDASENKIMDETPPVIYHFRLANIGCLLQGNILNIFDSGNLALKYDTTKHSWDIINGDNIEQNSLYPVQYRVDENCYPVCKSLAVCNESDMFIVSSSEFFKSDMLHATLGADGLPCWKVCTPPPFLYFTAAVPGVLNPKDLLKWKHSQFSHM